MLVAFHWFAVTTVSARGGLLINSLVSHPPPRNGACSRNIDHKTCGKLAAAEYSFFLWKPLIKRWAARTRLPSGQPLFACRSIKDERLWCRSRVLVFPMAVNAQKSTRKRLAPDRINPVGTKSRSCSSKGERLMSVTGLAPPLPNHRSSEGHAWASA